MGDRRSRLHIAAKLSFSDEQREGLQREWFVRMYLTSQGVKGIPTLLGIFYDPDVETAPLCLLSCHAGVSLQRRGASITTHQRYGLFSFELYLQFDQDKNLLAMNFFPF